MEKLGIRPPRTALSQRWLLEAKSQRAIYSSLSRVNTGGNAGLRGIVVEPIAWETAHFRAVPAGLYGSTATFYTCGYIARDLFGQIHADGAHVLLHGTRLLAVT